MDNKVGQNDKQKNVAEEEVAPSRNVRGSALVENQVEGEKKDSTAGNTSSSMAATTSTQKHAVIGDTNQSSTAELEAKATSSLESQKEQQTALQSTHTLTSQSTSKSMPTTSSNSYQSNTMSFKPEHSNSQFHTPYSDTEVDQKTISPEIIEDSNTTLRLTEMEGSSSSMGPGQPNASSSTNAVPKKIIRIDRDYSNGELCQFQTAFPLEIEERVNPRRFQQTIDTLNEMLVKAYNPRHSMFDNCLACLTIYTSTLCLRSHFDRTMEEVRKFLDNENITLYNPQGLNFRDPCRNSFLFIELELY